MGKRNYLFDIYENNTLYARCLCNNRTTANAKIQGKIYLYQDDQSFFLEETNLLSQQLVMVKQSVNIC